MSAAQKAILRKDAVVALRMSEAMKRDLLKQAEPYGGVSVVIRALMRNYVADRPWDENLDNLMAEERNWATRKRNGKAVAHSATPATLAWVPERLRRHWHNPKDLPAGYVYLVRAADGLCKIGFTGHLAQRCFTLKHRAGGWLELLHSIETDNAAGLEWKLHFLYTHRRMRQEWFALSPSEIAEIQTIGVSTTLEAIAAEFNNRLRLAA